MIFPHQIEALRPERQLIEAMLTVVALGILARYLVRILRRRREQRAAGGVAGELAARWLLWLSQLLTPLRRSASGPSPSAVPAIPEAADALPATAETAASSAGQPGAHERRAAAWLVVGASVIGQGHVKSELPCQDSHQVLDLGEGWGIAVVCDGAGSRKLSHLGSALVADRACYIFSRALEKYGWKAESRLPDLDEWRRVAWAGLAYLRKAIEGEAAGRGAAAGDFGCTVIVVIYSPLGLLATHIGDGRAGYRNGRHEWRAIITPTKGEEANETCFLTSPEVWQHKDELVECLVIEEAPEAFVLLTDGCEQSAFKCGYFDQERQLFVRQNEPHPEFFDPIIQTLEQMWQSNLPKEEIDRRWRSFIAEGTARLRGEPDDKTLVLGIMMGTR
jgi:hypothetical protein